MASARNAFCEATILKKITVGNLFQICFANAVVEFREQLIFSFQNRKNNMKSFQRQT